MQTHELEQLVRQVVAGVLAQQKQGDQVLSCNLPALQVTEADRLDTGNPADRVYTHDLFSLKQSPRLGAGLMEMTDSDFPWHLSYDEIDYVISGRLDIVFRDHVVSAGPGEVILIPKGSDIRFSCKGHVRFLYVTYPADWQTAEEA